MQNKIGDVMAMIPDWVMGIGLLALAALVSIIAHAITEKIVLRLLRDERSPWARYITRTTNLVRALFVMVAVNLAVQLPYLPSRASTAATQLLSVVTILVLGWTAIIGTDVAAAFYLRRLKVDAPDNLMARKQLTQIRVLKRTCDVLIVIITMGAGLMTFQQVRNFGVSLFASAGAAGLIVGLAARPLLASLIAGVQLAITQPIRIDDAVVVENEWGWIEEITSTYVVIKLWDWRRLIVPLSYFMEKPFQNWTRESSAIIGTAFLHADYRVPVEALRTKLTEIARQSPLWDKRIVNLQVTDAGSTTVEIRALVSARTSPEAWDLRCEVREKLLAFLQTEHPDCLPRQRVEVDMRTERMKISGENTPRQSP
ncbi:MAG: mechanosensitive ion channel family protein [Rhodospirillaceae bacterium]|nr:MAG: mechanosensitive ion channel family protein [Rhodospirillaceae bacterium]